MLPLQALPGNLVHQQVFVPQPLARGPVPQQAFKAAVKRSRSPSPPQTVPVSIYHQGYNYKGPVANTTYHSSPQSEFFTLFYVILSCFDYINYKYTLYRFVLEYINSNY